MFKQSIMQKHEVQMQFVKVFLGPSGWGVTVYLYGILYTVYTCMGFMYNLL